MHVLPYFHIAIFLEKRDRIFQYQIWRTQRINFATSKLKTKWQLTFNLWVCMLRDPKFWPTDPKLCVEFEFGVRSGFRSRRVELKGSVVLGSEGDISLFQGARWKLTSCSDSPYPKPHSTHFLVPTGIFGRIYRTEQYFGPGRGCSSGRKPVWDR